ncbi:hypothetical protein [Thermomonas sp.]|uniref:hypothetical protein n=1 Tax=Thermomonas sp. TaxID=1971895 RepID=UPI002612264C|nr:hypothetical protein [Thermomonas sp.]
MNRKPLLVSIALALGMTGALAWASDAQWFASRPVASGPDSAEVSALADPVAPHGSASWQPARSISRYGGSPTFVGNVTADDVGDLDSFGRNVHWLGTKTVVFAASTDCASIQRSNPGMACAQISSPSRGTNFELRDLVTIRLPAEAANSLVCHWLNDKHQVIFSDVTGRGAIPTPGLARYGYTITLRSDVLQNPRLINPKTGQPFAGELTTGYILYEDKPYVILPNVSTSTYESGATTCRDGLVSRQILMNVYGLDATSVDKLMASPMELSLNAKGAFQNVLEATFTAGLRLVGD